MIQKLKIKFIAINMLLVSIVLCVTFITISVSTYQRLRNNSYMALESSFSREKDWPKKDLGDSFDMNPIANKKPSMNHILFTVLLDSNNNIVEVFGENIEISDEVLTDLISYCIKNSKTTDTIPQADIRYMMQTTSDKTEIAFYDLSADKDIMSNLIQNFLLVGVGSLAAFYLISLYLAKWTLKPVEKSWEQQRQFIADASHELKTPLTVILANTDILSAHKEDTLQNQSKWLDYIKAEATRMSILVNDLLFLAKSDSSRNTMVLSKINFSDLVWSVFLPFESIAYETKKNLQSDIASDIYLEGDEGKLKQLVMIFLDNANKYTDKMGTIKLKLKQKQDKIYLEVINSGNPISADDLPRLFERFYRADESRARECGGYGLGLSIAKNIVDMHHGKIMVTSSIASGTTFAVIFPS